MRRQLRVRLQLLYCTDELFLLLLLYVERFGYRISESCRYKPSYSLHPGYLCDFLTPVFLIFSFPAESQSGERRGPTTQVTAQRTVLSGLIASFVGTQFVRSRSVVLFH